MAPIRNNWLHILYNIKHDIVDALRLEDGVWLRYCICGRQSVATSYVHVAAWLNFKDGIGKISPLPYPQH